MDRLETIEPPPRWLETEGLADFLLGLRLSGFRLGVEEFILIEDLILSLLSRGERFEEPARLADVLAPVICKSEEEQIEFHRRFADWWSTERAQRMAPTDSALQSAGLLDSALNRFGMQRRIWRRVALAGAALLVLAIAWWAIVR